ncbi:hypothetical protein [Roseateles violae]|uniref:Uncharacterized protein n=1 Tax=Roseateles violae TaxID=3058042 RepID=A0ABT8DWQ2_9BURK|nr:hypothetical protein [Pelomonas sp. PFR6]MDN3921510.1 hypothetical protein [Pelomonas sp. PFR6]
MLELFMPALNNLAGGLGKGLGDAIGGGGGGPSTSGGFNDARSSFDASGWTVSTGSSKATGGARSGAGADLSGQATMPLANTASQAGVMWPLALLLLGMVFIKKKGGK